MSMPGMSLDYEPLVAKHKLPEAMAHGAPEVQTDILERRRVRIVPQNGSAFGSAAGTQINILYSSNDLLDPESATLNTTFTWRYTATADGGFAVPDDGMLLSQISRARLYVAGVLVEDVNFASRKVLSEIYSSCPESVYKSQGSALWGAYKFVPELYANAAAPTSFLKNQPLARAPLVACPDTRAGGGAANGTSVVLQRDLSISLSFLFGVFRLKKYLPVRNLGQIQITLDLESNTASTFTISNANAVSYSLSNTEMRLDALAPSQTYAMFVDSFCAGPTGLSIPFETCQSLLTNYSGNQGQRSLVFSKQVKSLSHILIVRQLQGQTNFPISTFNKLAIDSGVPGSAPTGNAYTQIGAFRAPYDPATAGPLLLGALDAHHLGAAPFSVIMDEENYVAPVGPFGGHAYDGTCEAQVLGFSYEKTRGEDIMSVGLNTGAQNINAYITDNPGGGTVNCYGFVYFHQLLKIAGNMVKVEDSISA